MGVHSLRMGFTAVVLMCLATGTTARSGTVDLLDLEGSVIQDYFGSISVQYYAQSILTDDALWASLATGHGNSAEQVKYTERAVSQPGFDRASDATSALSQRVLDHLGSALQVFDVALDRPVTHRAAYFYTVAAFGTPLTEIRVRSTEAD